jgi:hypothetical protein
MTHLTNLLKNKLLLQRNFHTQELSMNEWPFWMFEENIKIVNQLMEEEESARKKFEEEKLGKKEISLNK